MANARETREGEIEIPLETLRLGGELVVPADAAGVVLFAHGSGSSRHSPRNQFVARTLRERKIGTLLFDLLTGEEEQEDRYSGHLRFDIGLLAERLGGVTKWYRDQQQGAEIGYFGSSTGAGAALVAEAKSDIPIRAIVSRGGRPDLAGPSLARVSAATLLLVGGEDTEVIGMNKQAYAEMRCVKELRIIPGATHLFEEPGTLERVADMASGWFARHFRKS